MTTQHRRRHVGLQAPVLPALLVATIVALAGVASAGQGEVVAAKVQVAGLQASGPVTETGALDLLHVKKLAGAAPNLVPKMTLTASSAVATMYSAQGYEISTGQGIDQDTYDLLCPPPTNQCGDIDATPGNQVTIGLTAVEPLYTVHVFGQGLADTVSYESGTARPMQSPTLWQQGISDGPAPRGPSGGSYWTLQQMQGPHVHVVPGSGVVHVVVDGDVTVEVLGADFLMQYDGGQKQLHSGVERPGVGPLPGDNVHTMNRTFLRITTHGGHLEIGLPEPATEVSWTSQTSHLVTSGTTTFEQAAGHATLADGTEYAVNGQTLQMAGPNRIDVTPTSSALSADGQRVAGPSDASSVVVPGISQGLSLFLGSITILVLGLAAAVVLAMRRTRQPVLADVEAAIEAGHYRRAAADAGRILRRRPNMEDALLSRAIALCKAGKPARVVTELQEHFAHAKPTDGSLHYVLGLAFMDLGRTGEAKAEFAEAVRRTPALLTDVQERLGEPGVASRTRTTLPGAESTHGYA